MKKLILGACVWGLAAPVFSADWTVPSAAGVIAQAKALQPAAADGKSAPAPRAPDDLTPSFSKMRKVWEAGSEPSASGLPGAWKLIGRAYSGKCQLIGDNLYDDEGIGAFGVGTQRLRFERLALPGSPDETLAVYLKFGAATQQGPIRVRGAAPQFELNAYMAGGELTKDAAYAHSCRTAAGNPAQLLCAQTIKLGPANWDPAMRACGKEPVALVELYAKE